MRPLRYSINVTLDGCCDHRAIPADEEMHRHAAESIGRADALLLGQVTCDMMEAAWRPSVQVQRDNTAVRSVWQFGTWAFRPPPEAELWVIVLPEHALVGQEGDNATAIPKADNRGPGCPFRGP